MFTKTKTYGHFLLVLMFLTTLAGCGGGGGSSSDSGGGGGTGSVGLLLTDGPTDDFDAVNITIVKAELLSDSGHVTIFMGEETIDLLDYRSDARIFSLHPSVPAGTYEKIRLTLSDIELVRCEDSAVIQPINVDTCINTIADNDQPRLKGNRKLDLNPRGDFVVKSGRVLMIEIDIDASKSIHIVETGNGKFNFRPVVFVKIISKDNPGKPVRVKGIVDELDRVDREFVVCSREINLLPSIDVINGALACVDVEYNDATLIFIGDVPVDPDDLHDGDLVTVFGNLRLGDRDDDVEHHVVDDYHHFDGIFIEAVVIDIVPDDTNIALDGIALTDVSTRFLFDMSVDPGQGFPISEVTVLIQPNARIVERDGSIIPVAFIQPGVPLSVYGDYDPDDNLLLAKLIVIDTDADAREKLSGVIGLIPDKVCGFNLVTNSSGDRSISADNKDTLVLRFTKTDLDIILVDDLRRGDTVHMFGQPDAQDQGCFAADIIVVFEKLFPEPK